MKWLLAAILLFPATALGVAQEVCGNGIDDPASSNGTPNGTWGSCPAGYMNAVTGNGCDLKCPGADQDNDGYTSNGQLGTAASTAIDCDDTNKWIFPGKWTASGCSAGQIRQCHATNGTYSACVAESSVARNTGSGTQYWIDCTNGNDANAGSYAAPFKTFGKVSGGSGATGLPASPVTLAAGDSVGIKNNGSFNLCNATITSSGGQKAVGILTSNGTTPNPITIFSYNPSLNYIYNSDGVGIDSSQHYRFEGIGFFTVANTQNNGSSVRPGTDTIFEGNYFAGMQGDGDNNDSCIYASHTNGVKIRRNVFIDCKRGKGNVTNISAIKWLDDDGSASECQDHEALWNGIVFSSLDSVNGGGCFYEKHGCTATDVGANKHPVKWNSCTNGNFAFTWQGSSLRADSNILISNTVSLGVGDGGESPGQNDNQFTYNTVYGGELQWRPSYTAPEKLTVSNNVFVDTRASYVGGNNEGIMSFGAYGSAGNKTTFETSPYYLSSNNNCFYNPNTALVFSYFNQGDSSGQFTFAQWKSRAVAYDAASYVENPLFDTFYQATSTNCSNKGRIYVAVTGGGTGATSLCPAHRFFFIDRKRRR